MTAPRRINLTAQPRVPAILAGTGPINPTRSGRTYTLDYDPSLVATGVMPSGGQILAYDPANDTNVRVAATGIAGVPYSGLTGVPAAIDAIDGLTPVANTVPYYTGSATAALASFTAYGQSLVATADAAAARTTLAAAASARTITAGSGLSGGGDLTADRTISWPGLNVRRNSTGSVSTRQRLNFIEGGNISLTVSDDAVDGEVDITISTGIGPNGMLIYAARSNLAAATVPAGTNSVFVQGHTTAGDGGEGYYFLLGSAPSPAKAWHVQSADGAWWELRASPINARQLGAVGNDSADETTALQAWADYGAAFGVRCFLPRGTFRVPTASITFDNDVIVEGMGDLSVVRRVSDEPAPLFLANTKDRVAFRDISFDNASGPISTSSVTIGTGTKTFTITAGLAFPNAASVMVIPTSTPTAYMIGTVTSYSGTTLTLNVTTAIGAGTFSNWRVVRNSGENVACRAVDSTNVEMHRCKATGQFYVAFEQKNCNAGIIDDCETSGTINRPFYCYATSGSSDDITISNCVVNGGGLTQYGINLNGSIAGSISNCVISNNRVEGTTFQGIEVGGNSVDCVVEGNTVQNLATNAAGILIQYANSQTPQRITVSNNSVFNCSIGIYLVSVAYTIVANNVVGGGINAIRVVRNTNGTCLYNVVSGNAVQGYSTSGISFESDSASLCGQSVCVGNTITGQGTGQTGLTSQANTDRIVFSSNVFMGNNGGNLTSGTNHVGIGNIAA